MARSKHLLGKALFVLILIASSLTVFANAEALTSNSIRYVMHNESDTQFTAYTQLRNASADNQSVSSDSISMSTPGPICVAQNWTTANFSRQTFINGTWNFSVFAFCNANAPAASIFAKIFRLNSSGARSEITNTTVGPNICLNTVTTVNTWGFTMPAGTNVSKNERVGVQFCVNVTTTHPSKVGTLNWENTTESSVIFTNSSDTVPPNIIFVSPTPANDSSQTGTSIFVNVTVTDDLATDGNCTLEFDGTNSTMAIIGSGSASAVCYFNKTGLATGTHNFKVFANDTERNENVTATRTVTISGVAPNIVFVSPTPANNSFILVNSSVINVSLNFNGSQAFLEFDGVNSSMTNVNNTIFTINKTGLTEGVHTYKVHANSTTNDANVTETRTLNVDLNVPTASQAQPANSVLDGDGIMQINCTAADSLQLSNVTLLVNDTAFQTLNTSSNATIQFNITGLGNGAYNWSCRSTDAAGRNTLTGVRNFTVNTTAVPTFTGFGGNTTNFTGAVDLTNVCNATLQKTGIDVIRWNGCVNVSGKNLTLHVVLSNNNITVNTTGLDQTFNSTAALTFQNLTYDANPVLFKDGVFCSEPTCSNATFNQATGTAIFNITSFSSYVTQGNAQMNISDETDAGAAFGGQARFQRQRTLFFANYTRTSNGNVITGATCLFNSTPLLNGSVGRIDGTMTFNSTKQLYEFNRTYETNGTYVWNVTCSGSGTQTLTTNDTVFIQNDTIAPIIENVTAQPTTVQFGNNITINASVTDQNSTTDTVYVRLFNGLTLIMEKLLSFLSGTLFSTQITTNDSFGTNTTVSVISNDTAGNIRAVNTSFIVNRAPNIVQNAPANNTQINNTQSILFNFTAVDDLNTTLGCSLFIDNVLNTTNTTVQNGTATVINVTNIPITNHTWFVNCTDGSLLNVSPTRIFIINDTVQPSISLNAPVNGFNTTSTSINFNWTATDNLATSLNCNLTINNTVNATVTATNGVAANKTVLGFTDGTKPWNVTCSDGTNLNTSETRQFTIDTISPNITILNPKNGEIYNRLVLELSSTATDGSGVGVANCSYSLNSAANVTFTCGTTVNITAVEGINNLTAYVNDSLGQIGNSSVQFSVNTSAALVVSIASPANGTRTGDPTPAITLLAIDQVQPTANFALTIYFENGTLYSAGNSGVLSNNTPSTISLSPSLNLTGNSTTYRVVASANDSLGNVDNSTDLYITVVPPVLFLLSPADGSFDGDGNINFTFRYESSDIPTANCSLLLNGVFNQSNATTSANTNTIFQVFNISEGTGHNWTIDCRFDGISLNDTSSFSVDKTKPSVTIIRPVQNQNVSTATLLINGTANDTGSGLRNVTIYINNVINGTATYNSSSAIWNFTWTTGSDGRYNILANASDIAGNYNDTVNVTITVDKTAPSISLNAPVNGFNTTSSSVNFNWTAIDNAGTGLTCNLTIANIVNASSIASANNTATNRSVTGFNDGTRAWNITCTDPAGNVNTSPTRTFTVDTQPPAVENVTAQPGTVQFGSNITINASVAENLTSTDTVLVKLYNGAVLIIQKLLSFFSGTLFSTQITVNDSFGTNTTFTIEANDTLGNLRQANGSFIVNRRPNIVLNSPANNSFINNTRTVSFNFTAIDDINTTLGCSIFLNGTLSQTNTTVQNGTTTIFTINNINNGTAQTWFVNCTDGFQANISETRTFTINITAVAPNIIFVSPTPANDTISTINSTFVNITSNVNLSQAFLEFDGVNNSMTAVNGTVFFFNKTDLAEGSHSYKVSANDTQNFVNVTELRFYTVDRTDPSSTQGNPAEGTVDGDGSIAFNCTVADNTRLANVTLLVNGTAFQTLNASSNTTIQFNITGLGNGVYNWSCRSTDIAGLSATTSVKNFTVNSTAVPDFTNFNGNTTNFTAEPDLRSVCNATLQRVGLDVIRWPGCVNVTGKNLTLHVPLVNNNITVNITGLDQTFNTTAVLTFFNLSYNADPVLFKDGVFCPEPTCSNATYNSTTGIAAFNVTSFSSFVTAGNANMNISDETDVGATFGGQARFQRQRTLFFANYTRNPQGTVITGATCLFNSTPSTGGGAGIVDGVMTFNATKDLYEFNRTFNVNGTYNWNVTCSAPGRQTLTTNDTVIIQNDTIPPVIANVTAQPTTVQFGNNITINASVTDQNSTTDTVFVRLFNGATLIIEKLLSFISGTLFSTQITVNDSFGTNTTISVIANDTAGNIRAVNTSVIGNRAPNIAQNFPANNSFINNTREINFNFTAIDDINTTLGCSLFIDNVLNTTNTTVQNGTATVINVTNVPIANHTWFVNCTDGSQSNVTVTTIFSVNDTIAPNIVFVSPTPANNSLQNLNSIFVNVTVSDNLAGVDACRVEFNGTNLSMNRIGSGTPVVCERNVTGLADGNHTFKVFANDTSNNVNFTGVLNVTIDTTRPSIVLNAPVNGLNTSSTAVNFNWTATDNQASALTCNLTIASIVNASGISSPNNTATNRTVSGFSQGTRSWNITCADIAGNLNTSETRSFSIDFFAPAIENVTAQPTTVQFGNNITINASVAENITGIDTVYVKLYNGLTLIVQKLLSFFSGTLFSTQITINDSFGTNTTFTLSANDTAGNLREVNGSFIVNRQPNIVQNSPANNSVGNDTRVVTFNWTAIDDINTTLGCSLLIDGVVNVTSTTIQNNTAFTTTVTNITYGTRTWSVNCTDGFLTNQSTRTLIVNNTPPSVNSIAFVPNSTDDLDPGVLINVTTNVTDSSPDAVLLQYKESGAGGFTDVVMTRSGDQYNGSFTASTVETWQFRINANDTSNNRTISGQINLSVDFDRTWDFAPADLGTTSSGANATVSLGTFTINNTGDFTLHFNLSSNYTGTLTFNETSFDMPAKARKAINVTAVARASDNTDNINMTLNVTTAGATPPNRTAVARLVTFTQGGSILDVVGFNIPPDVTQSRSYNFTVGVRNIGNESAINANLTWLLPAGFNVTNGSASFIIASLSPNARNDSNITIFISPSTATAGSYNINFSAHAANSILNDSVSQSLTVLCGSGDSVCGSGCTSSTDSDCAAAPPGGGGGGGGAGAGGGGGGGPAVFAIAPKPSIGAGGLVPSTIIVQVKKGETVQVPIIVANNYKNSVIQDVSFLVDGGPLGKYAKVSPSIFAKIDEGSSATFILSIRVPYTMESGTYTLDGLVSGRLVTSLDNALLASEFREAKLIIVEVQDASRNESASRLLAAEAAIQEMKAAGMNTGKLELLLADAKSADLRGEFDKADQLVDQILAARDAAFESLRLIRQIRPEIEDLESRGFKIVESKTLLNLGQAAFERGDYDIALSRLRQAALALALEKVGRFNPFYFLITYWPQTLLMLAIAAMLAMLVARRANAVITGARIENLNKKELVMENLLREAQEKYFQLGQISAEEYQRRLKHAKQGFAELQGIREKLRARRSKLLSPRALLESLNGELSALHVLIKKAQEAYFVTRKITKSQFDEETELYNRRLAEVEEERTTALLLSSTRWMKLKDGIFGALETAASKVIAAAALLKRKPKARHVEIRKPAHAHEQPHVTLQPKHEMLAQLAKVAHGIEARLKKAGSMTKELELRRKHFYASHALKKMMSGVMSGRPAEKPKQGAVTKEISALMSLMKRKKKEGQKKLYERIFEKKKPPMQPPAIERSLEQKLGIEAEKIEKPKVEAAGKKWDLLQELDKGVHRIANRLKEIKLPELPKLRLPKFRFHLPKFSSKTRTEQFKAPEPVKEKAPAVVPEHRKGPGFSKLPAVLLKRLKNSILRTEHAVESGITKEIRQMGRSTQHLKETVQQTEHGALTGLRRFFRKVIRKMHEKPDVHIEHAKLRHVEAKQQQQEILSDIKDRLSSGFKAVGEVIASPVSSAVAFAKREEHDAASALRSYLRFLEGLPFKARSELEAVRLKEQELERSVRKEARHVEHVVVKDAGKMLEKEHEIAAAVSADIKKLMAMFSSQGPKAVEAVHGLRENAREGASGVAGRIRYVEEGIKGIERSIVMGAHKTEETLAAQIMKVMHAAVSASRKARHELELAKLREEELVRQTRGELRGEMRHLAHALRNNVDKAKQDWESARQKEHELVLHAKRLLRREIGHATTAVQTNQEMLKQKRHEAALNVSSGITRQIENVKEAEHDVALGAKRFVRTEIGKAGAAVKSRKDELLNAIRHAAASAVENVQQKEHDAALGARRFARSEIRHAESYAQRQQENLRHGAHELGRKTTAEAGNVKSGILDLINKLRSGVASTARREERRAVSGFNSGLEYTRQKEHELVRAARGEARHLSSAAQNQADRLKESVQLGARNVEHAAAREVHRIAEKGSEMGLQARTELRHAEHSAVRRMEEMRHAARAQAINVKHGVDRSKEKVRDRVEFTADIAKRDTGMIGKTFSALGRDIGAMFSGKLVDKQGNVVRSGASTHRQHMLRHLRETHGR